ncbi:hypothetical protein [Aquibacillus saliphilus]|uniref:hypothetical protein n=1 Tax=Aquibacillus saliphilus TaxID=1909422 RepID=UPI001CF0D0D8|nr:hypothetical protein [Aquibacillus saliphilus]
MQQLIYSFANENYSVESTINFNGNSPFEKILKAVISENEIKRDDCKISKRKFGIKW